MRYILARWYLTSGHKKRTGWLKSLKFQWIPWMDRNRSLVSKRRITFVTSVLFFEKNAKIVKNLSGGCSTTLSWAFYRVSMDYGKRRNFTKKTKQKTEGVPIRKSRPVPLTVVWMGFAPLINVLKGLIANHSNSEGVLPMTANLSPMCFYGINRYYSESEKKIIPSYNLTKWMFITQLLNRASSMMWAAIQKKNACSHASSASNVHAFSTLYDGRNEKGQTCEGLSSERQKKKKKTGQSIKGQKSNRQNEKGSK